LRLQAQASARATDNSQRISFSRADPHFSIVGGYDKNKSHFLV